MSGEINGAQDPAIPPAAEAAAGGKVTSSAMQFFAPDPNAGGESVSLGDATDMIPSFCIFVRESMNYMPVWTYP
jgi:hypothetical protein